MSSEDIKELILRRRRQVLVHSVIYYRLNDNIVSDNKWAEWASELEDLQKRYPKEAEEVRWADEFKGFDHSTGCTLPLDDPWAVNKAYQLLHICKGEREC